MTPITILRSDFHGVARTLTIPSFSPEFSYSIPCIDLDHAVPAQSVLGFGVSMTDASAWTISRLPASGQENLIRDIFGKNGLNLSLVRLNVGSSDYASEIYNYDDVPDDVELKHFSIAHDESYLIPLMQKVKQQCPGLFLFASPWSPPGWMKTGGSMCGGEMRWKYLPAFADYYVKYLEAYRAHGLEMDAITIQNEPQTDQHGTMPQSFLHSDFEAELAGRLLPERLKKAGLKTKLWIHDHNYSGWKRICHLLSDPDVRAVADAVAVHPYEGSPDQLQLILEKYPGTRFQLTEKGPNIHPGTAEQKLSWWADGISGALNNGCESFCGWNLALDENGYPKTGSFDCAGLVEIHSQTGAITPSAQYHAFRHFAPYIQRGAKVLSFANPVSSVPNVSCLACKNPDGSVVLVIGSDLSPDLRSPCRIQFKYRDRYLCVPLPNGDSLTTIVF